MDDIIQYGLSEIEELKQKIKNETDETEIRRLEDLISAKEAEVQVIICLESVKKNPKFLDGWHLPGWTPEKD